MSGFLLVLAVGAVAWYAWPAADSFPAKVWTITFAVFLAPFSWPWLIARGHRARAAIKTTAARRLAAEAELTRGQNVAWWRHEFYLGQQTGDAARQQLALDVLAAMGDTNPPARKAS
ncbi:MAG: hypothetical protein JO057_10085 [Chloroflexi bacterium]|nr:hypothetical protein [Chloroflexota bacterium]